MAESERFSELTFASFDTHNISIVNGPVPLSVAP